MGRSVVAVIAALLVLVPAAHAKDMVFWANYDLADDDTISRGNLDGSGGSDLNIQGTTVASALGMAIDASAGKIYWADSTNGQIGVANLDGSGATNLDTTGATVSSPYGSPSIPTAGGSTGRTSTSRARSGSPTWMEAAMLTTSMPRARP